MKYKGILIFTLIITYQISVYSQNIPGRLNISFSYGYHHYDMSSLKKLNSYYESILPFDVIYVNNFDPGHYWGTSLNTIFMDRITLGINYQNFTTGSRLGQRDYSGSMTFDQILKSHLIGVNPGIVLLKNKFLYLSLQIQLAMIYSDITLIENLTVWEESEQELQKLASCSFATMPYLKLFLPVWKMFSLSIEMGKMMDDRGFVHLPGNKDAILNINNVQINTDWTGWLMSVSLNIRIIKSKNYSNPDAQNNFLF